MLHRERDAKTLSSARQYSLQGAEALEQQRWSDAENLFSEALQRSQVDERAHWGYAESLWQRGSYAEATKHMQEAVRLSGKNPDLLVRLGRMHLEQQQLSEAAEQAQQAISHHRKHAGAWALQGDVLVAQQKWNDALPAYHRALVCQPDFPAVQIAVAELYQRMNRPQRTLATLDRLSDKHQLTQMPMRAMWLKGVALADLGCNRESAQVLAQARELATKDDVDLLVDISQRQSQLGDFVEARITLGRVMQMNPNHASASTLSSELDQSFQRMASQSDGEKRLR